MITKAELEIIGVYVDGVVRDALAKYAPPPGERGPVGEKGEPGASGAPGSDGENGAAGPAGERGEKGERGEVGAQGEPGRDGKDGRDGVDGKDGAPGDRGDKGDAGPQGERGEKGLDGAGGRDGRDGKDGAPGRDGTKGDPGRDGKDGRDGITTEQLDAAIAKGVAEVLGEIEFDGRTWKIGDRTVITPAPQYKGVWSEGLEYLPGDMATFGGSLWHCNAAGSDKPGDESKAWTLAAKRGRDGRDAK